MPTLTLEQGIQVITSMVTLIGAYYALKASVKDLKVNQEETLRQLTALHKRLDHHGERISKTEIDLARQDERLKAALRLAETE